MYVVVKCNRCGNVYVSKSMYKTSRCPKCGYRNRHDGLRMFSRLDDALSIRNSIIGYSSV